MRTYGLVCMAAAALTVMGAYAHFWYGGTNAATVTNADLSRIVQGILTGIGFLCAGVIMKEGFNISGLTTAASLWAVCVIGILVGVGLYAAAIVLAVLCAISMVWISKLESWLPSRQALAISMQFPAGHQADEIDLRAFALKHGYEIAGGTIIMAFENGAYQWRFIAVALSRAATGTLSEFANAIGRYPQVQGFHVAYARN
jgi:putative Mg2+ transporter-C (MgtC) family protein